VVGGSKCEGATARSRDGAIGLDKDIALEGAIQLVVEGPILDKDMEVVTGLEC
jgi:hypothetical protein